MKTLLYTIVARILIIVALVLLFAVKHNIYIMTLMVV